MINRKTVGTDMMALICVSSFFLSLSLSLSPDDLTNPLFLDPVSEESISHLQHHSIDSSTPTSSIAANITVNNGVRTSTTTTTINRNGTIPRSLSIPGRDSTTSTSMIVVQFVDNDNGQRNTKMEYDHLCLMKYGRIESEETEISTPTG